MKAIIKSLEKILQTRIDNPVLTGPPGLLFAVCLSILLFARLAFSLDVEVVTKDGTRPQKGSLVQVFQETEIAIHNQVAAAKHSFQFKEVARLGIVYNLVTDYTAFLAVPESLKTQKIKEMIRSGKRGYDKKLVDSMEGIRLSMLNLPPGDPVLSVAAPMDAKKVVAYFPFGLVKRMRWDPYREHWSVRFLVPKSTLDGVYTARVLIVRAEGRMEWRKIEYTVDSQAPEFDAVIPGSANPSEVIRVQVDPFEPVDQ
jgi:hypothetical protein